MSDQSIQLLYQHLKQFDHQIQKDQTLNYSLRIENVDDVSSQTAATQKLSKTVVRTPHYPYAPPASPDQVNQSDSSIDESTPADTSIQIDHTLSVDQHTPTPLATENPLFGLKPASISIQQDTEINASFHPKDLKRPGDFIVQTQLGEGGMGQVFEGIQSCLKRNVALKISKTHQHELRFLAQVFHEAQITAGLEHPNILPIYLLAQTPDGRPIQVMKRIEGVSWHDLIYTPTHSLWAELKVAPNDQISFHLNVLLKVSQAMRYAHEKGIIHRDLKPENVMVGRFGEVYVLDWGVAIDLDTMKGVSTTFWAQKDSGLEAALVGTPAYMPYEMATRDIRNQGPWSDVYLLGAILYQIWTKKRLHQGPNAQALLESIVQNQLPPFPDSLSPEMRILLERSLAFNHTHRPKDASVFYTALKRAIPSLRSRELEKQGDDVLNQLYEASLILKPDSREIQTLFDEAKHLYLTALELWSDHPDIPLKMCETLSVWIRHLIQMGELTSAQQALEAFETELNKTTSSPKNVFISPLHLQKKEALTSEQYELHSLLSQAKERKEQSEKEHANLKKWRQNQDFNQSKRLRLWIAWIGLVVLGLGALTLDLMSRNDLIVMNARLEFLAALFLTSFAGLISLGVSMSRKDDYKRNERFTQFGSLLAIILIVVVLNRLIGWKYHNSLENTLLHEMPIIVIGCFGLTALSPQKDFNAGGFAFFGASLLSIIWPNYLTLFYAFAMITLWAGVLKTWLREGESELV